MSRVNLSPQAADCIAVVITRSKEQGNDCFLPLSKRNLFTVGHAAHALQSAHNEIKESHAGDV